MPNGVAISNSNPKVSNSFETVFDEVSGETAVSNWQTRLAFDILNYLTRKFESVVFAWDFLRNTISNAFETFGFEFERAVPPET